MELFSPYDVGVQIVILSVIAFPILFFSVLSSWGWFRTTRRRRNRMPPEVGGGWPVIGHLHLLGGARQLPHYTMAALANKYGPIFTIRFGIHRAVVVSSSELARQVFTTNDLAVLSRPRTTASKHLGYDSAMFGFSPYGPYWRELRKITSLELLSNRRLELLKEVRVSETEASIKQLYNIWNDDDNNNKKAVLVDMKKWFSDLALNVVLRMVVGKRYTGGGARSGGGSNNDDLDTMRLVKVMRDFFHLAGSFVVGDTIPILKWLDIGGQEKLMKRVGREMDDIIEGWLQEHRREKSAASAASNDHQHQPDFMDVLLSVVHDSPHLAAHHDLDTIVKATCMNLVVGGSDTSAGMLTWALSLLLNNPSAMRKTQQELDSHVGRQRRVDESDINKLVYLQAVVKETLRLYPPTPLSGPKQSTQDFTLGGYHIPKGTMLLVNIYKLQHDPNDWPDPKKFMPERFLSTHRDVDVKGQQFQLIPFSSGRRICPGLNLGLQLLHFGLASLLQAFEIRIPEGYEPVDMTETGGLTNMKSTPLHLLIAPRLHL